MKKGNPEQVKYETINHNGVILRGKRINNGAKLYKLTDEQIAKSVDGKKKSEDASKSYIINFGKYNGTKIVDMMSEEQLKYCRWFADEMEKNYSIKEKKSNKYKAFKWWLRNYNK